MKASMVNWEVSIKFTLLKLAKRRIPWSKREKVTRHISEARNKSWVKQRKCKQPFSERSNWASSNKRPHLLLNQINLSKTMRRDTDKHNSNIKLVLTPREPRDIKLRSIPSRCRWTRWEESSRKSKIFSTKPKLLGIWNTKSGRDNKTFFLNKKENLN